MGAEASGDFVISRVFDAPRKRVWSALTEAEHLKEWWPPKSFTMIAINVDLRPGGMFHCGMRSVEGFKMWAKFVYRDVVPPDHLTFVNSFSNEAGEIRRHPIVPTWPLETLTAIALADEAPNKTKLTITWSPHNANEIERKTFNMSHIGLKAIWNGTFDQLATYLAKTA